MSDRNLYYLIWVNAYLPSPKLLALKAKKGEMPKMLKKDREQILQNVAFAIALLKL